jgi:hypothetical protein
MIIHFIFVFKSFLHNPHKIYFPPKTYVRAYFLRLQLVRVVDIVIVKYLEKIYQ